MHRIVKKIRYNNVYYIFFISPTLMPPWSHSNQRARLQLSMTIFPTLTSLTFPGDHLHYHFVRTTFLQNLFQPRLKLQGGFRGLGSLFRAQLPGQGHLSIWRWTRRKLTKRRGCDSSLHIITKSGPITFHFGIERFQNNWAPKKQWRCYLIF